MALNPQWVRNPAPRKRPVLLTGLPQLLHHPATVGSTRGLTSEANSLQHLLLPPPAMPDCGRVCDRPGFCGPPRPVIAMNRPSPEVINSDFCLRRATCLQAPVGLRPHVPVAPIPTPSSVPSTPTSHCVVFLKKLWSSIPCLGLLLKELKAGSQGNICESYSLFTTAKRGKQPVSTDEQMDKRNVAHPDCGILMQSLKGRTS